MTEAVTIPFDPELLETWQIIRSTPTWKVVKTSIERLKSLRKPAAMPYDQMEVDRDNVLRYAEILKNSSDAITYGICLAAHLARCSTAQAFEERWKEGFQALSTGLDLAARDEADTRTELQRCAQAAFADLQIQSVPLTAPSAVAAQEPTPAPLAAEPTAAPLDVVVAAQAEASAPPDSQAAQPAVLAVAAAASPGSQLVSVPASAAPGPLADLWRAALEDALAKIRDQEPLNWSSVIQKASDSWQTRLVAFTTGLPEVPPDIDYLRCCARKEPLGTILRPRLKSVTFREWNDVFSSVIAESKDPRALPRWFALGALAALGFDVPKDLIKVSNANLPSGEIGPDAQFVSKLSRVPAKKGLLILRVTADSVTASWNISTMPAISLTPDEFLRPWRLDLQDYFRDRLHGVLVELNKDEQPSAAQSRARYNEFKMKYPSVRFGYLLPATPQNTSATGGNPFAVLPADAMAAYTQTFGSTTNKPDA